MRQQLLKPILNTLPAAQILSIKPDKLISLLYKSPLTARITLKLSKNVKLIQFMVPLPRYMIPTLQDYILNFSQHDSHNQ